MTFKLTQNVSACIGNVLFAASVCVCVCVYLCVCVCTCVKLYPLAPPSIVECNQRIYFRQQTVNDFVDPPPEIDWDDTRGPNKWPPPEFAFYDTVTEQLVPQCVPERLPGVRTLAFTGGRYVDRDWMAYDVSTGRQHDLYTNCVYCAHSDHMTPSRCRMAPVRRVRTKRLSPVPHKTTPKSANTSQHSVRSPVRGRLSACMACAVRARHTCIVLYVSLMVSATPNSSPSVPHMAAWWQCCTQRAEGGSR